MPSKILYRSLPLKPDKYEFSVRPIITNLALLKKSKNPVNSRPNLLTSFSEIKILSGSSGINAIFNDNSFIIWVKDTEKLLATGYSATYLHDYNSNFIIIYRQIICKLINKPSCLFFDSIPCISLLCQWWHYNLQIE